MVFSPLIPAEDHLRTENEVLIKKVGDPGRKLKALETRMVSLKISPETFKALSLQAGRKNLHDFPSHDFRIEGRFFFNIRDDFPKDPVNEVVGERKLDIGTNPMVPGQLHGNPPLHALALDHDDFAPEGRG